MRWIAVGAEAEGVIAIGQVATGVIALGQMATGVIAVGQIARGFVAVGQGAIGVFAVGMGSVGLVWSVGMVGLGGRGFGIVLPLVPSLGPRHAPPDTIAAARLADDTVRAGHVRVTVDRDDDGPLLRADGRALPARLDARLRAALDTHATPFPAFAHLSRGPDGWICDTLVEIPAPRWKVPGWWVRWAAQLAALAVAAILFWLVAGIPVVSALFDRGGILVGG